MNDIPVQLPLCKQGDVQTGVVQILPVYVEGHWHVDGAVFFFQTSQMIRFYSCLFLFTYTIASVLTRWRTNWILANTSIVC